MEGFLGLLYTRGIFYGKYSFPVLTQTFSWKHVIIFRENLSKSPNMPTFLHSPKTCQGFVRSRGVVPYRSIFSFFQVLKKKRIDFDYVRVQCKGVV